MSFPKKLFVVIDELTKQPYCSETDRWVDEGENFTVYDTQEAAVEQLRKVQMSRIFAVVRELELQP